MSLPAAEEHGAAQEIAPTAAALPSFGHPSQATWPRWASFALGVWLVASPAFFEALDVKLAVSEIASGAGLMALALLWHVRGSVWPRWTSAGLGVWLLLAPLVFWTTSAAAFTNDTMAGILAIFFAVLVPQHAAAAGSGIPPGWTYNPASWSNRVPIIAVAVFGFLVAHYMAAYQLGHIRSAWDPFFGQDTETILRSSVAEAFPISDAGLGSIAYLLEGISGILGDTRRWRTMPWMVATFFLLVVPSGLVSVALVILQPVAVGAWCTLCLVTAAATVVTVPPALDEIVATGQHLLRVRREGRSMWTVFWFGDPRPAAAEIPERVSRAGSWTGWLGAPGLIISLLIGIWLVAAPTVLGYEKALADITHLTGALVITFSIVAMAEVGRAIRFVNILFGLVLIGCGLREAAYPASLTNSILSGLALIPLSLPRGSVRERYGSWDRFIV